MSLLLATIIDARRRLNSRTHKPVSASHDFQPHSRLPDAAVPGSSPAAYPANHDENISVIKRFQKEGSSAPRKAPESAGKDRHGPLADVKRLRESKERVTTTVVEASGVHSPACNDLSVLADDSRKSNLETGEGAADGMRQNVMISEMSSFGSVQSLEFISSDASSVESFQGQSNSASIFESGLQGNSGKVSQSWTPGHGAPSDSSPAGKSKAPLESHFQKAFEGTFPGKDSKIADPEMDDSAVEPSFLGSATSVTAENMAIHDQDIQPEGQFGFQNSRHNNHQPEQNRQPNIRIGQIDVIVLQEAPPKQVPAMAHRSSESTASRRYWRRL